MAQLATSQSFSEDDRARLQELTKICRANSQGVVEWCEAVLEIKKTCIWMLEYKTWAAFCGEALGLTYISVYSLLTSDVNPERESGESRPKLTMDDEDDRREMMASVAKSMTSAIKRLAKMMRQWPQDDLPKKKTIGEIALWMADNGVIMDLRGIDER